MGLVSSRCCGDRLQGRSVPLKEFEASPLGLAREQKLKMEEQTDTPTFCDRGSQSSAGEQKAPSPTNAAPVSSVCTDQRLVQPAVTMGTVGGARTLSVSLEQLAHDPGAAQRRVCSRKPGDGNGGVTSADHSEEELNQEDAAPVALDDLSVLDRLGLSSGEMTEEEMEAAFVQLALAFRCDQHTLRRRLQVEQQARNLAERNVWQELDQGRNALQQVLRGLCLDSKRVKILQRLELCFNILARTVERISSTAEVLGAVHQEARTNRAVELMMAHVENLQRRHVRDSAELEEARRLAERSSCSWQPSDPRDEGEMRQKLAKSAQPGSRRRVSVAVVPSTQPQSEVQRGAGGRGGTRTGRLDSRPPEAPLPAVAPPPPLQVACPPRSPEPEDRALSAHSPSQEAVCGRPRSRGQDQGPVTASREPEPHGCGEDTRPALCLDPHKQGPLGPWMSKCRRVLLWLYVVALVCVILTGVSLWFSRGIIFWM
ncbi:protein MRVI1-like [Arapaima gigas]